MSEILDTKAFSGYTHSDSFRCLENLPRMSSDLFLSYCGWERTTPLQLFAPVERRNHVIHFVLSGKGKMFYGNKTWEISGGQIFYISPGEKIGYVSDRDDPWSYVWIGYNGVQAEEYSKMAGLTLENPVRFSAAIQEISDLVEELLKAQALTSAENLHRMSLVLKIMSILIKENDQNADTAARNPEEPDFVRLAMQYISQNFDKNLRIHDIAAELGVSRSYLSSCFKKSIGCSPQAFILNLRMERAGSLLRTTTLPVNVISGAVGYQDQLAFSKIFKQFYGVSPRDFRKGGNEVIRCTKKGDFENHML